MNGFHHETDYERERAQQIMNNRKLLEDVGLGGNSPVSRLFIPYSRLTISLSDQGSPALAERQSLAKRRLSSEEVQSRHRVSVSERAKELPD